MTWYGVLMVTDNTLPSQPSPSQDPSPTQSLPPRQYSRQGSSGSGSGEERRSREHPSAALRQQPVTQSGKCRTVFWSDEYLFNYHTCFWSSKLLGFWLFGCEPHSQSPAVFACCKKSNMWEKPSGWRLGSGLEVP